MTFYAIALHRITLLRATERHLPYGISQCYLPPDTGEGARLNPSQAGRCTIFLPRRNERLSSPWWLVILYTEMVYLSVDSHSFK